MVDMTYEDTFRLIDANFFQENIESILLSTDYIPFILRGFLDRISIDPDIYKKWRKYEGENDKWFVLEQKILFRDFYKANMNGNKRNKVLFDLLELLIFLKHHPQFNGIIKEKDYLDELVVQCEKEYNIDIDNYTNDYKDIRSLFNDNRHKKLTPIYDMVDHVYSNLINDELIHSKYYVHPMFLSNYAYDKRLEWIREYAFLIELNKSYIAQFIKLDETEQLITVMEVMKDFIKRNPQHSQLINDYPAFNEYLESLYKKKYSENPKYKREID